MMKNVKIHGHLIKTGNEDINVESIPIQIAVEEPEISRCASKCNNEESFMCSSEYDGNELHITAKPSEIVQDDGKSQVCDEEVGKVEPFDDYIQKLHNEDVFDIYTKYPSKALNSAFISFIAKNCPILEAIYLMEETLALRFESREHRSTSVSQLAMILIHSMRQLAMFSADASSNNFHL